MRFSSGLLAGCLTPLLTLLPALAHCAPITFNTALPVAQGEFLFRQQLRWLRSSNDSTSLDRKARATAAISVLAYGVNSKLAVFGVLPYLDKELEINNGGQDITRSSRGFGDISTFVRYNFYQDNAKGSSLRLSAVGGFAAPTGDDKQSDKLGRLPPPLQSGSGAWNVFGGMVATYQTLGYQFDGQLSYRNNREANSFEAGDETRLDLSWQHRVWPRELGGGVPGFFYAVLELNALHQGKNRVNGRNNPDSGGNTFWLSPGLQYVTRRWVLEAVVQKPISQNLNGNGLDNDWIVTTSFRMNF